MAKKRVGRYPNEFRRMCVERMKQCDDIVALAAELDIHRRLLYRWRDQFDPVDKGEWPPPQNSRESTLRKEVSQLKRVLAEKDRKSTRLNSSHIQKARMPSSA